ncbi:MAG: hypothetical protein Q7T55_03885 [Solirubrobacteraceae bacterium]|nr:hypothetical protein [Solirubrobacteraceae bacterium]
MKRALSPIAPTLAGFLVVALGLWLVAGVEHSNLWAHTPYDSYTLQAMAWRDGHVALSQNYEWLELAIFKGDYYVSFPPLPSVVMWVLTFPFGENTPSGAVGVVYFVGGLLALWALLRRYLPADQAALWLVFVALGGTILSLVSAGQGASGGVWFQAQLLAFFLTSLAFLLVDGKNKIGWVIGLSCLALAVGCRPFNLIYAPALLWMLSRHLGEVKLSALRYLAAPVAVLAVYGIYNFARFGNPTEFGHTYLPELAQAGTGMFLLSSVPTHLHNVLSAPSFEAGKLVIPQAGGFAVYLTNPMILIGLAVILVRGVRRKADALDAILLVTILLHAVLLLSHRTNGGWQYGTRYLTDLLPVATYVVARSGLRVRSAGAVAMGAVIAFNLYAILVFQSAT